MAYNPSVASLRCVSYGITPGPRATAGTQISAGGSIFTYCSSHSGADISGVVGFFVGCGQQPSSAAPAVLAHSTNDVGIGAGDLVCNIESSAGVQPGRVTWHCVKGSTYSGTTAGSSKGSGFDISVSTQPSS